MELFYSIFEVSSKLLWEKRPQDKVWSHWNFLFSSFTFYKMSNLDNRIANADQLLTQVGVWKKITCDLRKHSTGQLQYLTDTEGL